MRPLLKGQQERKEMFRTHPITNIKHTHKNPSNKFYPNPPAQSKKTSAKKKRKGNKKTSSSFTIQNQFKKLTYFQLLIIGLTITSFICIFIKSLESKDKDTNDLTAHKNHSDAKSLGDRNDKNISQKISHNKIFPQTRLDSPISNHQSNTSFNHIKSELNFESKKDHYIDPNGIIYKNISGKTTDCEKKTSGHSSGKICIIDGVKYFLKRTDDAYQSAILGKYNLMFLKKNIGITVPNAYFFYERTQQNSFFEMSNNLKLYFASEEVIGFVQAEKLFIDKHLFGLIPYERNYKVFRKNLSEKIGENGIVKLAVASTFIDDLKPENFGYNKNGLVIVDADISPQCLKEYLPKIPRSIKYFIDLSIENIIEMKNIYSKMLTIPLPRFHKLVDMENDTYKIILTSCIEACTMLINEARTDNLSFFKSKTIPNKEYNIKLAKYLDKILLNHIDCPELSYC